MNRTALLMLAAMATAATAVGCNGSSSARETEGATPPPAQRAAAETAVAKPANQPSRAPRAAADRRAALPPPDAAGIVEASFDDVKFPMVKTETFVESMLTDRVKSLFGQRIRIRGYMYPTNRKRGLKQFVLVRDNMECCFGPGAALFDCVLVTMKDDATAEYSIRPIAVEGEFRFDALPGRDGRPLAIYQMSGEAVK
jgi:hypothetical protein